MVKAGLGDRGFHSLNLETFPVSQWDRWQPESLMRLVLQVSKLLAAACVIAMASTAFAADDGAWTVSKSSGEVWLTSSGVQPASLKQEELLKPGDTVRTGRTGRVLLKRGEETMLISPNSVVGMPAEKKEGLSTTIVQQAGSILLEVEKRNVKHFEVETPYLAAVVKGTQFRVSVDAGSARIDVIRGQVEVADFRSGQIAQVLPGQVATAFAQGKAGLSLSGSGAFSPMEQGRPRASTIERIMVPKTGLSAPRHAANGQFNRALGHGNHAAAGPRHSATRISASLGEVGLNFHKVTHGLAHGAISTPGSTRSDANKDTVWNSSNAGAVLGTGNGPSQGNSNGGNGSDNGNGNAAPGMNAAMSGMTAAAAAAGNGNGNGNGNNNGANGNGNNGNGNGHTK